MRQLLGVLGWGPGLDAREAGGSQIWLDLTGGGGASGQDRSKRWRKREAGTGAGGGGGRAAVRDCGYGGRVNQGRKKAKQRE